MNAPITPPYIQRLLDRDRPGFAEAERTTARMAAEAAKPVKSPVEHQLDAAYARQGRRK